MNVQLLYQWEEKIREHLPSLNSWQTANVALFSYGVIRAQSCDENRIAQQVVEGEKLASTQRRWRRFLSNAAFPLREFFEEWTRWVVSALKMSEITLLVDETKLQDQMGVMMVGIAWEGRCLPLAWRVYLANSKADYPAEGQVEMILDLLRIIKAGLPPHVSVLVLADRGIGTSPALCRGVASLGWRYLFRVTSMTKVIADDETYTIADQVQSGGIWYKWGKVFKKRGQLPALAIALWEKGYDEPWVLVTNDRRLTGHEYARRNWQEQAFRDLKSGGWHWGDSRIRQPAHTARLLVVLVMAYVWMVALGSQAVAKGVARPLVKRSDGKLRRRWSLFKEGVHYFFDILQRQRSPAGLDFVFIRDQRFP